MIEPIINTLSRDTSHLAPKINEIIHTINKHDEILGEIRTMSKDNLHKLEAFLAAYEKDKNVLEQRLRQIEVSITETNMHIAKIAASTGDKSLIQADYSRPAVDDLEKEFGVTTDQKANLTPTDAPKFEDGENPFDS